MESSDFVDALRLAESATIEILPEIQSQVFTLALEKGFSDSEIEAIIIAISKVTGISKQILRRTWKQFAGKELADNGAKQSEILSEIIDDSALTLFHDPDSNAFARVLVDDHYEVIPIRSKKFKLLITQEFYRAQGKPPGAQAIQDALALYEARATFEGPEYDVHVRLTEHDNKIYLDLADELWRVVEIDEEGWRILEESPVMFRRPKGLRPLSFPLKGGISQRLFDHINVAEKDQPLLCAFLVACLYPRGPYPILILTAEQGSGKSTQARLIKSLIDPNISPIRSVPKNEHDLLISSQNNRVLAYDNLSSLSDGLSDALCRLSTGGGFATRELYSDAEEIIFDVMSPVILTGIDDLATRSDLLDRSIIINLPRIQEENRRTEKEINQDFELAHPFILGAFLDAISSGLKALPTTKVENVPRMADFITWATACEIGLELEPGSILKAYRENRSLVNETALSESPLPAVIQTFINDFQDKPWEGSASDLLIELDKIAPEIARSSKAWPKAANALSNKLTRIAPNLREAGCSIEKWRDKTGSKIRLQKIVNTVTASSSSESSNNSDQPNSVDYDDDEVSLDDLHITLSTNQSSNYLTDDGDDDDDDKFSLSN